MCTIVLPWGKYKYLKLSIGLSNSLDVFQEKMGDLFSDLENVKAYIDDLLVLTKGDWEDHLAKLDEVLTSLSKAGLKVNIKKSFFGKHKLEYLGYWISQEGIQLLKKKVEAILKISKPTTKKQLCSFIGIINYYRDMWRGQASLLAPLSKLNQKMPNGNGPKLTERHFIKYRNC